MNRYKSLLIVFLLSLNTIAQNEGHFLSKKEMHEDFDSFVNFMEQHNPNLPIYKKLMGLDIISDLKNRKKTIDTITNCSDFHFLIFSSLSKFPEIHSRLLKPRELMNNPNYSDSITLLSYKLIHKEAKKTNRIGEFNKRIKTYKIPVMYINGFYYAVSDFTIINTNDSIKIPVGSKLESINKLEPNLFVDKYKSDYTYVLFPLQWDVKNKRLHSKEILLNDKIFANKNNLIEFTEPKNKRTIKTNFNSKTVFVEDNKGESATALLRNKVLYFDNILYVKMINMYNNNNYFKDELQKYKAKKIEKVIIDVRDNPGGGDYIWENVLSYIIDTTLVRREILAVKSTDSNSDSVLYDKNLEEYYKLIVNYDYLHKIEPDSNSINYKGKIYLIHNRNSFSSANAFVTFALSTEKIIAVGENTGYLEGYGLNPILYQLPNSKLVFQVKSVIHLPRHIDDLSDYFWNKTEVEVRTTPSFEALLYKNKNRDIYTKEFLKNDDVFMKKVLEMK